MDHRSELLARRARRLRADGEFRKAANAYGELTSVEPARGPAWVLLGTMLLRIHRDAEALKAFRQAHYLFRRAGEPQRAVVVQRLITQACTTSPVAA